MGGACFKPVFLPPSTTHTPRWAGSWFSGMPGLLSQHRESWLSVFWEMSGLQETKDSHSHHPAGGWGAERAGCMGNGGPSVQRAGCEGVFTWAGGVGTRIWLFEAEGELAKWRGSMCKGNVCWGHMCSKERCDEPTRSTNKRLTKCSRNGAVSFYKRGKFAKKDV